jgi:hypothetical protein
MCSLSRIFKFLKIDCGTIPVPEIISGIIIIIIIIIIIKLFWQMTWLKNIQSLLTHFEHLEQTFLLFTLVTWLFNFVP